LHALDKKKADTVIKIFLRRWQPSNIQSSITPENVLVI